MQPWRFLESLSRFSGARHPRWSPFSWAVKMPKAYGADLYICTIGEVTKLGRSSNVQRRLSEIRRGVPWLQVELFATFPKFGFLEAALHRQLGGHFEKRNEWYLAGPSRVAEIVLTQIRELEAP